MTKYFCDRCGEETKDEDNLKELQIQVGSIRYETLAEICKLCLGELENWLKEKQ